MAFGSKNKSNAITTVIGPDSSIKGTIDSQGSVRIEGAFEGTINSQGEVFVSEGAVINANIHGRRVVVAGEVKGVIEAINGLEITSTGRVYGDIIGDRLIVDEGAVYKGNVNMDIITSKRKYEEEKLGRSGR